LMFSILPASVLEEGTRLKFVSRWIGGPLLIGQLAKGPP